VRYVTRLAAHAKKGDAPRAYSARETSPRELLKMSFGFV
jgi:hypothetical protein